MDRLSARRPVCCLRLLVALCLLWVAACGCRTIDRETRRPWSARKPVVRAGELAEWAPAPEFLAWRLAEPAADGFAGPVLTVSLTGPFHAGAWSQHAGALYALPRVVPAGQPFAMSFRARSVDGSPHLTVLRTWGGAKPWKSITISREWQAYRVVLTPAHETDSVTFSLVPKAGRLQPYCAGTFELAEVRCEPRP